MRVTDSDDSRLKRRVSCAALTTPHKFSKCRAHVENLVDNVEYWEHTFLKFARASLASVEKRIL